MIPALTLAAMAVGAAGLSALLVAAQVKAIEIAEGHREAVREGLRG